MVDDKRLAADPGGDSGLGEGRVSTTYVKCKQIQTKALALKIAVYIAKQKLLLK
jgi:hypothetical protein